MDAKAQTFDSMFQLVKKYNIPATFKFIFTVFVLQNSAARTCSFWETDACIDGLTAPVEYTEF